MVSKLFMCDRVHFAEFHPDLFCFSPPNQAKTNNPGNTSDLKSGHLEDYCLLKTGYMEEF